MPCKPVFLYYYYDYDSTFYKVELFESKVELKPNNEQEKEF